MARMDGLAVTNCERCPALVESRTQIVNGTGATDAALLFVGEGPGATEDREGDPFVGRSGEVLNEILDEHGIERAAVRITNCIRCRPPENRNPTSEELDNCREYLDAEIARVDPLVIVTLGKVASEHLLGRSVAVTSEAGEVEEVDLAGATRRVLVCVHPAATLYDPDQRETLERAIGTAVGLIGQGSTDGGQSRLDEF